MSGPLRGDFFLTHTVYSHPLSVSQYLSELTNWVCIYNSSNVSFTQGVCISRTNCPFLCCILSNSVCWLLLLAKT